MSPADVVNVAKSLTAYVLGVLSGMALVGKKKPHRATRPSAIDPRKDFKMVLVVNTTLKMGKGKIGAQCAHGACGALETATEAKVGAWKRQGQAKVCLQATQVQLLELAQQARTMGLNHCLVADAGRTQIAPGSKTVLAIGPDDTDTINALTGTLKLL